MGRAVPGTYRYAFVEFGDRHGFTLALGLTGNLLGASVIKVGLSKVGQVRPGQGRVGVRVARFPRATPGIIPVALLSGVNMDH